MKNWSGLAASIMVVVLAVPCALHAETHETVESFEVEYQELKVLVLSVLERAKVVDLRGFDEVAIKHRSDIQRDSLDARKRLQELTVPIAELQIEKFKEWPSLRAEGNEQAISLQRSSLSRLQLLDIAFVSMNALLQVASAYLSTEEPLYLSVAGRFEDALREVDRGLRRLP